MYKITITFEVNNFNGRDLEDAREKDLASAEVQKLLKEPLSKYDMDMWLSAYLPQVDFFYKPKIRVNYIQERSV